MVSMMKLISTLTVDIDESYDLNKVLLSIRITPVTLYRETIFQVIFLDIHEEMRCLSNKMI